MSSPEPIGKNVAQSVYAEPLPVIAPGPNSLLGQVLAKRQSAWGKTRTAPAAMPAATNAGEDSSLEQFLGSKDDASRLLICFGAERLRQWLTQPADSRNDALVEQIDRDIATIDNLIEHQLNEILHAEPFQRLEASWRGIKFLVDKRSEHADSRIVVRILNVRWAELSRDFEGAVDFDQSQFFRKVYEEGMGQAGAEPFSCLLADYFIHPRLSSNHAIDDMNVLRGLAHAAAAAFCPLITNADPSMFAVDRFSDLKNSVNLQSLHSSLDYFAWQRFREIPESRFVSLALPRLLMRQPYLDNYDHKFPFTERVVDVEDYLWGGAAYGMGEVLMRAFADSGWFANIRGAQRGIEGGGLVTGPAFDPFGTEPYENAGRSLTDFVLTDEFERELSGAGFLPLCACKEMPLAAFYSSTSTQKPKEYNTLEATMSARLSTMLNYMLCVSRFAHYLKQIARDKIGSCDTPEQLQDMLQRWILNYVSPDKNASAATRLRKPLLEAEIRVSAIPSRAGEYNSEFYLVPHHELDDMRVSIRLDTKLLPPRS